MSGFYPVDERRGGPGPQRSAFGEASVAEPTPIVQVYAVYGVRDDMQQLTAGPGAAIYDQDSNFVAEGGTGPANLTTLLTNKQAQYRAGQGLRCRLTALFESHAPNSRQGAGLINAEAIYGFGYDGDTFGVARAFGGVAELQRLTITAGAAGAETATVTLGGTPVAVDITAGTPEHNAYEIATYLDANVDNYFFTSNGAVVEALFVFPLALGAFAFSSATAVAAWVRHAAGTPATYDWVHQADWDNPPGWAFDPSKGNVYEIVVQYLGYGGVKFYIENPSTAEFELVHTYSYANQHVVPSVANPTFRVGWAVQNLGNTSNLIVRGASAAAFVEGKVVFDERSRGHSGTYTALGTTKINLLSLRNRHTIHDTVNRISVYPKVIVLSAVHNRPVVFHVNLGDTFQGDLVYTYKDEANSAIEVAEDRAEVLTVGREVITLRTRSVEPLILPLKGLLNVLLQGEVLTISAVTEGGSGAEADYSIVWGEDP